MILFPFTIARNNEIRNIENRILIDYAPYTIYSACCKEKIAVDEAVF